MKIIDSNLPPPITNPSWLRRLLNRFCGYETMSGNGVCPVYLERWTISEAFGCGVYLHHFLGDDWGSARSSGLWGWYWEDVFWRVSTHDGAFSRWDVVTKRYQAPWVRSFPAEHLHRVRASECGNTWTLVIVLRKSRPWGFVKDGLWIPFKNYVFGGKYRKAC